MSLFTRLKRFVAEPHVPWFIKTLSPRFYNFLAFGSPNPNTRRYWDRIWEQELRGGHLREENYEALHASILDYVREGSSLLDVGCGSGALLRKCARIPGVKLFGCDLSPVAVAGVRDLVVEARVIRLPTLPVDWTRQFDLTVCTEVLEHLDHPESAVGSMVRCLKPGGRLVVSVPADEGADACDEHVQTFDAARLQEMFSEAGLEAIEVRKIVGNERTRYWLATATSARA